MAIIDDLKLKVKENERLVVDTRDWHIVCREETRQAERLLRIKKREMNKAYKDWCIARKQLYRARTRLSSYPSKTRRYAKEHMDKVFKLLENGRKQE
jgi:hypothetical protein